MHTFTIFLFWAFISTLNTPLRPKLLFAHKLLLMGVEIYRDAYLSETPSMIPCPTFTVKQATFVNWRAKISIVGDFKNVEDCNFMIPVWMLNKWLNWFVSAAIERCETVLFRKVRHVFNRTPKSLLNQLAVSRRFRNGKWLDTNKIIAIQKKISRAGSRAHQSRLLFPKPYTRKLEFSMHTSIENGDQCQSCQCEYVCTIP